MSDVNVPQEILALPISDRIELVHQIWDSIADDNATIPLSKAHEDELRRRLDAHRQDPSKVRDWATARKELFGE